MSKHIVAFFLIAVLYPVCRARCADLAADAVVADRVEARLIGPGGAGQAEALEAGGLAVAGDLAADAACLAGGLAFLAPLGDVPMGGFTNAGVGAACAAAPSWWAARGVTDGAAPAGDFAAAVQGQVKWIARQAAAEFDAWLAPAGGAGPAVSDLLASFSLTNNFRAVTLGQLKNAAAPFHDRLAEVGLATNCPWAGRPADSALANVGQVKALFAFDLSRDSDGDGMPDGWEAARGLNPGLDDAAVDADGDGVPNRQEYLRGTDPGDALSKNRIVYADADAGSAGCDGYFQTVLPGGGGPKATVQQAVDVAVSGDTLEVRGEAAFADAVVAPGGKKLVLRPVGHVRF